MTAKGFKTAQFDENTIARFLVVAAQGAGKRIRVRGAELIGVGTTDVTVESDTVALGVFPFAAGTHLSLPPTGGNVGEHYFICADDEALNISLSAALRVAGVIFWDTVEAG